MPVYTNATKEIYMFRKSTRTLKFLFPASWAAHCCGLSHPGTCARIRFVRSHCSFLGRWVAPQIVHGVRPDVRITGPEFLMKHLAIALNLCESVERESWLSMEILEPCS